MLLMLAGLVLFLLTHGITAMREQRTAVIARIGYIPYMVVNSAASIVSILMIAYGFGDWRAEGGVPLWYPPVWTRHLALVLMLLASIMLVAGYSSGRIKATLKYPVLTSIKTWALAHLLANGDVPTIVLALVILAWVVYTRISMKRREPSTPRGPKGWAGDAFAIGGGIVLYLLLVYVFHPYVIGVPVMPA
ncbi:MAG: NnrU family protein [Bradyrhizobiaceae bacterium]|nr:NnrU family protein [Bradyrhizobiaceae bacterium]